MYRWQSSFLLIFSAIFELHAVAQDDPALNYREKCRRNASGAYADAIADLAMAEDGVVLAENAKKKAFAVIDIHEAKLKLVNKKLQSKDYGTELLAERDSLTAQVKLYHEQYMTSDSQLENAKKNMVQAKKRHGSIKKKVDPLFHSFFTDDPDGGERKLFNKLEWKSECPKYRTLCPLPAGDAEKLLSLIEEIDDHNLACHRYAKLK